LFTLLLYADKLCLSVESRVEVVLLTTSFNN